MVKSSDIQGFADQNGYQVTVMSSHEPDKIISGPNNIQQAQQNQLSFISEKLEAEFANLISSTNAGVVFIKDSFDLKPDEASNSIGIIIRCSDAKKAFIECLEALFSRSHTHSINEKAYINETATLGVNVNVGAFTNIEEGVAIGDNTYIGAHVSIKSSVIGNNVIIEDGTVIGGHGFGYVKQESGEFKNFPHYGRVMIGDDVYIGSNNR